MLSWGDQEEYEKCLIKNSVLIDIYVFITCIKKITLYNFSIANNMIFQFPDMQEFF